VQVVDEPEAQHHQQHDDDSSGKILPHAAVVLLVLELPKRIGDWPPAAARQERPPRELYDRRAAIGVVSAIRL
jgi:hypothetical protein